MKLILNILLIILIITTAAICVIKPDMHKSVVVFDSEYKIVPEKKIEVEKQTVPIMEKKIEPVKTVKSTETQIKSDPKTIKVSQPVKTTVQNTSKKQIQTEKKVQTTPSTYVVEKPAVKKFAESQKQTTKTIQPRKLTEQEEKIAWNEWRSKLQNQIMQDVKLPYIPTGTVFRFTFTVDKYGKISNLKTWSENPAYTPHAIQYIAPIIRSYQGREILNFPNGTARVITDFNGGWRISESVKYSKPQDYNDIETVRR